MKHITITIEDEVARWAESATAKTDTSVSDFMRQLLERRMREDAEYEAAERRFMSVRPYPLGDGKTGLPAREALYDREILR